MQQTFVKTINGFDVEFNRLLFPTRYKVLLRRPNHNPEIVTIFKSGDQWVADIKNEGGLINSLVGQIIPAIRENEAATVEVVAD